MPGGACEHQAVRVAGGKGGWRDIGVVFRAARTAAESLDPAGVWLSYRHCNRGTFEVSIDRAGNAHGSGRAGAARPPPPHERQLNHSM